MNYDLMNTKGCSCCQYTNGDSSFEISSISMSTQIETAQTHFNSNLSILDITTNPNGMSNIMDNNVTSPSDFGFTSISPSSNKFSLNEDTTNQKVLYNQYGVVGTETIKITIHIPTTSSNIDVTTFNDANADSSFFIQNDGIHIKDVYGHETLLHWTSYYRSESIELVFSDGETWTRRDLLRKAGIISEVDALNNIAPFGTLDLDQDNVIYFHFPTAEESPENLEYVLNDEQQNHVREVLKDFEHYLDVTFVETSEYQQDDSLQFFVGKGNYAEISSALKYTTVNVSDDSKLKVEIGI